MVWFRDLTSAIEKLVLMILRLCQCLETLVTTVLNRLSPAPRRRSRPLRRRIRPSNSSCTSSNGRNKSMPELFTVYPNCNSISESQMEQNVPPNLACPPRYDATERDSIPPYPSPTCPECLELIRTYNLQGRN